MIDPWVGSAWEDGFAAAEAEHRECDQGLGGAESERDPGDQADLGVDRFDQGVGEAVLERGVDPRSDGPDAFGEVHEGGDARSASPGEPSVECVFAGLAFDREHVAQALFEQVAAVQARVGLGELVALAVGEVLGVLPEGVAGALERSGVTGGVAPTAAFGDGRSVPAGVVPGFTADLV